MTLSPRGRLLSLVLNLGWQAVETTASKYELHQQPRHSGFEADF